MGNGVMLAAHGGTFSFPIDVPCVIADQTVERRAEASGAVLPEEIKNASTSFVDNSVHKARFLPFLGWQAASGNLVAYFVGIESRHVVTTAYSVDDFLST